MFSELVIPLIVLFAITFISGILTSWRKLSDDLLHLFLSFGAGIFLGVVFVHLLPESLGKGSSNYQSIYILLGFLLIFFVERFLLSRDDQASGHKHRVVSYTVLIGLCAHSLIEGFGLSVISSGSKFGSILFLSILAHKIPAAIALASLLSLAKLERRQVMGYLLLFSLMAPAGALILVPFSSLFDSGIIGSMTGLVTGSFLYVATGDLLPEVFHSRRHRWLHLFLLLAGIITMMLLGEFFPDHPGH